MPPADVVVLTGAGGQIGDALRPHLAGLFGRVRLVDQRPIGQCAAHEESLSGDLFDPTVRQAALRGASAIIHLTGLKGDAPWAAHLQHNVHLVEALLADAHAAGVQRIALPSTMHVLGFYRRRERITPASAVRPDSPYAASKVAMEALGAWHQRRTGARVSAVRIGCFKLDRRESEPCAWIGPEDLARLYHHLLWHPRGDVPIVHAVAPYRGDDCGQRALRWRHGFRFRQHGGSRRRDLANIARWYPTDMHAREYRGGVFASSTLTGQPLP